MSFRNKKENKIICTTSWDDGNRLDLKLVELLEKYQIKGTFYVSKEGEKRSLSDRELKILGEAYEIGAHTITHPDSAGLAGLSLDEAKREISGSKNYLENLLEKEIKMFCYPLGRFNQEIKDFVKESGFLGARTTKNLQTQLLHDFFEFGTTLQVYPFPFRKKDADHYYLSRRLFNPLQQNFRQILKLKLSPHALFSWLGLAKSLFDHVLENGEIYHLWGHSWEIEQYRMWEELEEILKYIANRENVLYLSNGQVLETPTP